MKATGNTTVGAEGMRGIELPTGGRPSFDTTAARIEAAETHAALTAANRLRPTELRRAYTRLVRETEQLKAQIGELTEQLAQSQAQTTSVIKAERKAPRRPSEVMCTGGCNQVVIAEYVTRTGKTWHGPCEAQVPAEVRAAAQTRRAA